MLGLVGLMSASMVAGYRSVTKAELRGSASKLAGAIRYVFDRASSTGKVHRLVLDFEEGKYWAEVSGDRFFMPREREDEETRLKELEAIEEEQKEEAEQKRRQESASPEEMLIDPSRYQPTEWKAKRPRFEAINERLVKPVELRNAKLAGLFTPRYAKPISQGQGYLYFFPLGQTEPAVVHVSDEEGKSFFSLLVHPLSGKVKVHGGYIEPRIDEQFDDEGNRVTVTPP